MEKNQLIRSQEEMYLPTTSKELLEIYSPIRCLKHFSGVTSVKDALMVRTPSLGLLVKSYGVKVAEAYIKVWLINLNSSLNLKRPLEEHHIDECAFLVVSEYRNICIADINIIFRNAKLGKYGELYESLSIDKILRWFSDYFNLRCDVAGEMSRQSAEKFKYEEQKSPRSSTLEAKKIKDAVHEYNLNKLKKEYGVKGDSENQESTGGGDQ